LKQPWCSVAIWDPFIHITGGSVRNFDPKAVASTKRMKKKERNLNLLVGINVVLKINQHKATQKEQWCYKKRKCRNMLVLIQRCRKLGCAI
jgi:hypothetical protein